MIHHKISYDGYSGPVQHIDRRFYEDFADRDMNFTYNAGSGLFVDKTVQRTYEAWAAVKVK